MNLIQKLHKHYQQNLPFVAYKKPNETIISALFQFSDEVLYTYDYKESGFVFAPFNDDDESIIIPKNKSEFLQETINFDQVINNRIPPVINKKDEEFHCKIVDKAISKIVNKEFRKVVLSRKEQVEVKGFKLVETFERLVVNYSRAMVYVWFHPKIGLWLGATPETLLKVNGNKFETMSLAGTQVDNGLPNTTWEAKEIDEQQVVTDYIIKKLQPICEYVSAEEIETVKAGGLLHLKTKISGILKTHCYELITSLHPTPAVCGFPKEKAKNFILQTENYNREFYTGFLGELNFSTKDKQSTTHLYVNLRCMQIKNEKAFIYVGGGVTRDSDSQKEWEETVAKSKTMKSVL